MKLNKQSRIEILKLESLEIKQKLMIFRRY